MKKFITLVSFVVLASVIERALPAPAASEMKTLTIRIKPEGSNQDRQESTLAIQVEIVNTSNQDFELTTLAGKHPFAIRIYTSDGVDVNRYATKDWSKDRTNRNARLRFAPGETKVYPVRLERVRNSDGEQTRIPPGTYFVSVVLPVVSYAHSEYKVDLLKSDPATIEIK